MNGDEATQRVCAVYIALKAVQYALRAGCAYLANVRSCSGIGWTWPRPSLQNNAGEACPAVNLIEHGRATIEASVAGVSS